MADLTERLDPFELNTLKNFAAALGAGSRTPADEVRAAEWQRKNRLPSEAEFLAALDAQLSSKD